MLDEQVQEILGRLIHIEQALLGFGQDTGIIGTVRLNSLRLATLEAECAARKRECDQRGRQTERSRRTSMWLIGVLVALSSAASATVLGVIALVLR